MYTKKLDTPQRAAGWLPGLVGRIPASLQAKLLVAFLSLAGLLLTLGIVAIRLLGAGDDRTSELEVLIDRQRVYLDLISTIDQQLAAADAAFSARTKDAFDARYREIRGGTFQFVRFVDLPESDRIGMLEIEKEYDQFALATLEVVDLLVANRTADATVVRLTVAGRRAALLKERIDGLVEETRASVRSTVEANSAAYRESQPLVLGLSGGSVALAIVLGYATAGSVTRPVRKLRQQLRRVETQDFSGQVNVSNRDELGDLAAGLNQMTATLGAAYAVVEAKSRELEAASRHKSEFLANMSHELRTPLNAVIGFSEVLGDHLFGPLNEKQDEYVQDILSSGKHLLSLINDILDLSKVEAGRMELKLTEFDLQSALANGISMVKERAQRNGLSLSLSVDPALNTIEADERKLKQVVFNLLSNAVKFTPEGGRVEVVAHVRRGPTAESDSVVIAVRDTGVGVPAGELESIFEEFRQSSVTGARDGTGLGLTLAKRLAELQGGAIQVQSELSKGSTFELSLPLRTSWKRPTPAGGPIAAPEHDARPGVLVIEDDPRAAELLRVTLEPVGFQVRVAPTGESGLVSAQASPPQAIVLDLLLPDQSGWDVLRTLKANPTTKTVPVVVVSMLDERGKGFALGADDYVVKPANRDELVATLRRLVEEVHPSTVRPILAIDDDPLALELLTAVLSDEGFQVITASGGRAGVDRARTDHPALVIVDLLMPEFDGFAVIDALRADPATRETPIVVLTAQSLSGDERAALDAKVSLLAEKSEFNRTGFATFVRTLIQGAAR